MAKLYSTILTDVGAAMVAAAILSDTTVDIALFAVGDGMGAYYVPDTAQTALRRETYRGSVSALTAAGNIITADMVVPASVTGFVAREIGLLTTDGQLVAVGNLPDVPKDALTDGAIGDLLVTMQVAVANTDVFTLAVDPNSIVVTRPMLTQAIQDVVSAWDADGDGIVDVAAAAVDRAARDAAAAAKSVADAAMPKTGGTFTGVVTVPNDNRVGGTVRNAVIQTAAGANVSTNYLLFRRK